MKLKVDANHTFFENIMQHIIVKYTDTLTRDKNEEDVGDYSVKTTRRGVQAETERQDDDW
jgi:hypothetical protein